MTVEKKKAIIKSFDVAKMHRDKKAYIESKGGFYFYSQSKTHFFVVDKKGLIFGKPESEFMIHDGILYCVNGNSDYANSNEMKLKKKATGYIGVCIQAMAGELQTVYTEESTDGK